MGAMLRGAGLRRTPVRVAVLGAVIAARKPLAAPDIIRRLGEDNDPVTVYRTLKINEGAPQLWYKSADAWSAHMSDLRDAHPRYR